MLKERVTAVWQVREREQELARTIAPSLGIHPVAAEILLQRGMRDRAEMQRFLYPDLSHLHDPGLLTGMEAAVVRIRQALELQQPLAIYGDYDADGLTATALLVSYLREQGADVSYYIPKRLEEGYGLHRAAIAELASRGVRLIITVDCGINAQAEVSYAQELGIDVIITDHHTPEAERIPEALAVINPKLSTGYPFLELAGVGVALKLVQALSGLATAAKYLDLVALGTIADVVPLLDENRALVRFGLEAIRAGTRPGIRALLTAAGVEPAALRSGQVAFTLAPRLNAAGRLNEAELALELLLTEDVIRAQELAARLNRLNLQRQEMEQQIFAEADEMVARLAAEESWCIVLASATWHPGVIGIVASRLAERYHRPTILLAIEDDIARGSGRSIAGYDLVACLSEQAHLLTSYGGHRAAAGLSLGIAHIPALRKSLNEHVRQSLSEEQLRPQIHLDAELDPSEISLDLVHSLEKLDPYGAGHPEPVFCSKRWRLNGANLLGKEGKHLKLELQGGGIPWEVLAWRRGQELAVISEAAWLDVAFTPQANLWNGQERLVLHMRSWRQPIADDAIPIYDARFLVQRDDYLQGLLQGEQTVLLFFWPSFSLAAWPKLQVQSERLPFWQQQPLYLQRREDYWEQVPAASLPERCDLVLLDVPHGLPSLARLAADLGRRLYHQRVHLLYNVNDIERIYRFMVENGPNRSALATLYRGLRALEAEHCSWQRLNKMMQADGFLGSPDQINFHLQVLNELALAEYACSSEGVSLSWLPRPQARQDLTASEAFVQAEADLAAFAAAKGWLAGPDAAGMIARQLRSLICDPVSG